MLNNQNRRLSLIVLVSISLHLALFTLLYIGKHKPIVSLENPPIIQAELLFVDTASFVPVEESLPADDEQTPSAVETEIPKEITAPEEQGLEPENLALPPELDPVKEPINDESKVEEAPEPEIESPPVNDTPPTFAASDEQQNRFQQPVQDVAKSQLNSYQQSQLNSLAAQAASEYRQQRDHPKLGATESDSFLTEAERFEQKVTTSVDCSSASSQALATVAGFMGGKVKCSEPPPFEAFIQKRLNKTAELPAMQNQDNSNQP
ncbi:hypothetical protein [Paraglaciecola sp. 25GB23A]|uniref:hypothetical protein n=1 Tax=Paraglaciecola sp. 25GB23A TaxID=3156068 RepID=UPI0032AF9075